MKRTVSCPVKQRVGIALLVLGIALAAVGVSAQNPILRFSFEEEPLVIPLGGSATTWLRVDNASVYEADAIEIMLVSGAVELAPAEPIEVLDAFSDARMAVTVTTGSDAVEGDAEALFELSYTYCVADVCFQIVEEITLGLAIIPAVVEPINSQISDPIEIPPLRKSTWWEPVLPIVLGLLLVAALIAGKIRGRRWWVTILLLAILVTGLGYGIMLKQDQQAQSIGAVLCTSCVGIEETPHEEPDLSEEARARIAALTDEIELLLFTATWCHACPYAKSMVEQVIAINTLVSVRLIDVDESKDAADRYGIIQSNRTIVPAILRVDTGEVVFGIEDLEARLMSLLEGSS